MQIKLIPSSVQIVEERWDFASEIVIECADVVSAGED